jgi:ectoine hydroxylase-related dioxygenase (phytanoyl-CoA dioxygenase family)
LINEQGVCWLSNVLSAELVQFCYEKASTNFENCLKDIERQGYKLGVGIANGFDEIVQRHTGRYDMQSEMNQAPFTDREITRNPKLMPILRGVLGLDCKLAHISLVISSPGCEDQRWHIDGEHLYRGHHLEAHALNVFIPLVPLTEDLGPTEFTPSSHYLSNTKLSRATMDAMCKCKKVKITCNAGDAIIFDYRVIHRGTANVSKMTRPHLCLVSRLQV